MSQAPSNTEELFRFTSTRSPSASARRDTIDLADDSAVAAWVASANQTDYDRELARLAGSWQTLTDSTPQATFKQLQDASRGAAPVDLGRVFPLIQAFDAADSINELLTGLWKFYLQGIASGTPGAQMLQRCQQMIVMATLLQALAAGAALEATPALLSAHLGRKLRLPASFEQELHALRAARIVQADSARSQQREDGNARLQALLGQRAALEQLEASLAAALGQAPLGEPALPGTRAVSLPSNSGMAIGHNLRTLGFGPAELLPGQDEHLGDILFPASGDGPLAAPVDMEHAVQPAADPDAQFKADNAPLLAALAAAGIPALRLSGLQLLDEVRRLLAKSTLALVTASREHAGAPALQQAGAALQPLLAPPRQVVDGIIRPAWRFGIRPLGVADLRSVRQVLVKYDKGELAHVENVLQGETRERTHERYQRVEEGSFSWTERENESTRDAQSTDRFELAREARNAVYDFTGSQAGINISATYGEVYVNSSANFYTQRSTEQALTESLRQSREIVNRAVERVRALVIEQRYRSSVVEVRETTRHTQTAGEDNVVGQYFWIDKVYQAQVYNYGARAMYELMVPRPAALYTHLLSAPQEPGLAGPAPARPLLAAADITEATWMGYAERYGVALPPPPPLAITEYANAAFPSRDNDKPVISGAFSPGEALKSGYLASHAGCSMSWFGVKDKCGIAASIGNQQFSSGAGAIPVRYLGSETGAVSFSASGWGPVQQYTVNFFLVWQRTQRALEQWQLACHKAIIDDYERRLATYNERAAAARTAAGQDAALTAEQMRTIERNELRRAVLEIVRSGTGHTAPPPCIDAGGARSIDVDRLEAAAREVRFFEQAFEWDQMTYRFHPYFWDQPAQGWDASSFRRQGDAVFTAFLNAGFASVILPVRSGYEDAAALYLQTGVVLDVDVAPADEALAAMNAEVAGRNALPDNAVAEGEPWTYRVPTSLVVLEDGLNLPLPDFSA